ncbi:MAG TPA: hypothetical protein VKT82_12710 [Ktedonobacterales bacterium]|nr:hypothetical protein [Ktedonobacterales bacterium]
MQAAEACLRQAEQECTPPQSSPSEFAKHQSEFAKQQAGEEGDTRLLAETVEADERQARLRAVALVVLSWKGGLKVLRQAQFPKWQGYFRWQIETKIEVVQTAYAALQAEAAKPDG